MGQAYRQLLIGLDAMEWSLVRKWSGDGTLPVLRRLIGGGFSCELTGMAGQFPDAVSLSIATGVNPAKFGYYFYCQYDGDLGDLAMARHGDLDIQTFWDALSDAGKRVAVIDVPEVPLSARINGLQVCNWGAHATRTARATNPPGVMAEIDARFPRHPIVDCDRVDDTPKSLRAFVMDVEAGVRAHGELFRWAWAREPWDVYCCTFSASHCVGHQLWHKSDPEHPRFVPGDRDGLADGIKDVYRALDDEVGKLVDLAGPGVRTIVYSGEGMGGISNASWHLMEILDLLGYGRGSPARAGRAEPVKKGRVNPWRVIKMLVPGAAQYAIKDALPKRLQDELVFRWYAGRRDWKGRRAIAVPNNEVTGAIRLLVVGRDKHGVLAPEQYDAACRDIREAMEELTDPVTGRKVVRAVTLVAEEFEGSFRNRLPDITVLWDQRFHWSAVRSPRFGTLEVASQDRRSGGHDPRGFLVASGPGVARSGRTEPCSIYDIAPTALALAGVPVPRGLDGKMVPLLEPAAESV